MFHWVKATVTDTNRNDPWVIDPPEDEKAETGCLTNNSAYQKIFLTSLTHK